MITNFYRVTVRCALPIKLNFLIQRISSSKKEECVILVMKNVKKKVSDLYMHEFPKQKMDNNKLHVDIFLKEMTWIFNYYNSSYQD